MLEMLKRLLDGEETPERVAPEARVAVAALLVEAARSDADYEPAEAKIIERVLREMFGLSTPEATAVRAEGEAAQAGASDLVRFTRVAKTELDDAERMALMEALWSVALADETRDPHEDALLRKLAPLLALTDRDSAEARRRAAARIGNG